MWSIIGKASDIPVYIITIPAMVAKSACIWDPIIYLWTNRMFRRAFYNTIPCRALGRMMIEREERKNRERDDTPVNIPERQDKGTPAQPQNAVVPAGSKQGEDVQQKRTTSSTGVTSLPPLSSDIPGSVRGGAL